jgi:phenylpropionate dioxygenase-like ring-hydroxylating dioxygenase large terminal subunit
MLTVEETKFLTSTDRGTPMGDLFRRYWHPFLLVDELPEADGAPVRVRLLGEDLIVFRDTNGKVGLIDERCPHRGASLFFAINQECGMMCIYHGWKFDVNGDCVDMPSDLPGSTFKDKVHINSYPCLESAGAIWTYMGPVDKQPPPPKYLMNVLPEEEVMASRTPIYCNYLQSIEGNLDSTHLGTLHLYYDNMIPADLEYDKPGHPSRRFSNYITGIEKYARIDVQDTDYGYRLIAVRKTPKGNQHIRINCLALPVMSWIASQRGLGGILTQLPIDDENCMRVGFQIRPGNPFTAAERDAAKDQRRLLSDPDDPKLRLKRLANDYQQDRAAQKSKNPPGIYPIAEQDYCVTETMGPIMDRTKEHLYHGDAAIIRLRQMLGKAARDLQEGIDPPGTNGEIAYHKIRSEDIVIGPDDDPWLVATNAGETAKPGERLR